MAFLRKATPIFLETNKGKQSSQKVNRSPFRSCMGTCPSKPIETGSIPYREVHPQHPVQSQVETSAMGDGSDFNNFMELVNQVASAAREKYSHFDELWGHYCELQKRNEEIMAENQSLRQR